MRYALLTCLLLGFLITTVGHAQTRTDSTKLAPQTGGVHAHTQQDSVQALHNLFNARRKTGNWFVGGGLLTTLVIYPVTALASVLASFNNPKTTAPTIIGVVGLASLVPGVGLRVSFSRGKEKKAVEGFQQSKPLPTRISTQLQDKFFHR